MKSKDHCTICQAEKECMHCHFGINNLNDNPVVITDYMFDNRRGIFDRMLTLPVCDTCAKEKGKSAEKAWITLLVAAALYALTVLFSLPVGLGLLFMLVQVVASFVLLSKAGFSVGKFVGLCVLQMLPFAGFLLLLDKQKIDQNIQATSALLPIAKERFTQTAKKEADIKQKIESGEVIDAEVLKEYKRNEARKQAQQEVNTQKARSGRIGYAIFGIIITAIIILQGYGVYSADSGYMTWLGIRLTPVTFSLLIVAFLVFDILALVFAFRKRK